MSKDSSFNNGDILGNLVILLGIGVLIGGFFLFGYIFGTPSPSPIHAEKVEKEYSYLKDNVQKYSNCTYSEAFIQTYYPDILGADDAWENREFYSEIYKVEQMAVKKVAKLCDSFRSEYNKHFTAMKKVLDEIHKEYSKGSRWKQLISGNEAPPDILVMSQYYKYLVLDPECFKHSPDEGIGTFIPGYCSEEKYKPKPIISEEELDKLASDHLKSKGWVLE